MKICGRKLPIDDFKADLFGRVKEIGGGLGDGIIEEHQKEDENFIVSLMLGTSVPNVDPEAEKRANPPPVKPSI